MRSYLIRKGFAEAALSPVILAYRETNELVEREAGAYDSASPVSTGPSESPSMQTSAPQPFLQKTPSQQMLSGSEGKLFMSYTFTGGRTLECRLIGDVPEEEALDMMETLITLKKKEIERNAKKAFYDNASAKMKDIQNENDA